MGKLGIVVAKLWINQSKTEQLAIRSHHSVCHHYYCFPPALISEQPAERSFNLNFQKAMHCSYLISELESSETSKDVLETVDRCLVKSVLMCVHGVPTGGLRTKNRLSRIINM